MVVLGVVLMLVLMCGMIVMITVAVMEAIIVLMGVSNDVVIKGSIGGHDGDRSGNLDDGGHHIVVLVEGCC